MLSLILSYHYKILAGFCFFLLFVNIIKAYTPRSLARNKIFKTIFYISLSRFSLASNSSVHLFWIVNRLFCLTKITSPRKCLNKNKGKHFFYFFSLLQEDLFGTIFRLFLPSLQCTVVKISQIQVKRGFVKESDDFATGSTRNYTRIYRMIYFPCVCVFLNLLTYSLTSTYAHSKQKPRKVWVKSPSSPASSKNSVTIESVFR